MNAKGLEARWWQVGDDEVGRLIVQTAAQLEADSADHVANNLAYLRASTGRAMPPVYGLSMSRHNGPRFDFSGYRPPTWNGVEICIETLIAKVGNTRPWPLFLTNGGDFTSRSKARNLSRFVDGVFHATSFYRSLREAFADSLRVGTGWLKVASNDDKSFVLDVVPDSEVLLDEIDAIYGRPRSIIHRRYIAKDELLALFPDDDDQDAIRAASGAVNWMAGFGDYSQMVALVEGWSLPTPDGKPGKHVLAIDSHGGHALLVEPWKRKRLPLVPLRHKALPTGMGIRGQGLVEVLMPLQAKVNKLFDRIDDAQRACVPHVLVEGDSKINAQHIAANVVAAIIRYKGTQPKWEAPPGVSPELYRDLADNIDRLMRRAGISPMSAQGEMARNLDSGEAIRTYMRVEDQRFTTSAKQLEECVLDVTRVVLDEAFDIKPVVRAPGRNGLKLVSWENDAALTPKQFEELQASGMTVFPISTFPQEPAAKLQRADEWRQLGIIDAQTYARCVEYPDIEGVATNLVTAARDDLELQLDKMVFDGEYQTPEPRQDPQLALEVGLARYLHERSLGTPQDRLDLLRQFLDDVEALQQRMAPPPPPQPPGPGAARAPGPVTGPAAAVAGPPNPVQQP